MTSLPLLSYKVTEEDGIPDRSFAFTLYHTGQAWASVSTLLFTCCFTKLQDEVNILLTIGF